MTSAILVAALVAPVLGLVALTTAGARRRGHRWALALVSGVFFPVTWAVWYALDEHPYRHGRTAPR